MARRPIDITIPDLTGKRVVLTGGSDGMGLRIATRLAAAGAELILPVRNPRKGEAAIATIRESTAAASVSLRSLELSSLDSVAALGETLRAEGDPIHIFIGNAGVMHPPTRQTTADGFELQFGTNHLGHAALIAHLMPLLQAGRARVTLQLSIAANQGAVNWASRRLISALSRLGVMGTVDSAGLPALMAATAPGDAGGRFYGPSGIRGLGGRPAEQKLYSRLRSLADARRMWDVTQELIGVPFPAN